jgi:hypothetical protein
MTDHQCIHTLGTPFDFDKITLTTPTVVQGGSAHFTKLLHGDEALYVQTPTCETRQGMVISGRKAYYDIVIDPNSDSTQSAAENAAFLEWVECLEDRIIRSLHDHGKVWFRDPLSEDDIRTLFTSPLKPFKGGKQFSIRINVLPGKVRTTQFNCTVFDEKENSVQVDYITETHNIISIVEVLGVRFTSNSFQLELASKQIAVIVPKPVFQTCIIKKDVNININTAASASAMTHVASVTNSNTHTSTRTNAAPAAPMPVASVPGISIISSVDDIRVDDSAPSLHIKDPLEVYYALYKAARKRAHEAKQVSIEAYLDAKNIKNTYNLQLVDDDSDDSDDNDDDDSDHDDSDESADGDDNREDDSDDCSESGAHANDDDENEDVDLKKRPPINISGDSISLSALDYDALG